MAKKSMITVASAVAGLVLISVASAIALRGDKGPDFTDKSPEEIKDYFESDTFQNMNERDQLDAKKRAMGSFRRRKEQTFIDQATIYSKLPPQQRIRFLDERINEYVRAAKQKQVQTPKSGSVSKSGSGAKGGDVNTAKARAAGKPSSSEGIRAWSEWTDPEQRAHILEFKEAIIQRMEERGIDP
jgi:hypothetical protein